LAWNPSILVLHCVTPQACVREFNSKPLAQAQFEVKANVPGLDVPVQVYEAVPV
jgi:hypothetical protein